MDELKMAYNRAKDRQRVVQEDPEVIGAWFTVVDRMKICREELGKLSLVGI